MDLSEIEALIDNLHMSRLVITGGEPLMQQGNLRELLVNLYNKGYSLEIETNGTIQPDSILVEVTEFWNVSPKMSNSLLDFNVRIRNNALKEFAKLPNAYFKFVIQDSADIAEVKKMIDVFRIPKERIFLMPQGNTMALINRINYWLLPICVSEGYRYSPRLHIALWEDQRGR
jgi:organic radical activating enzyme